jgi:hypothetical protein
MTPREPGNLRLPPPGEEAAFVARDLGGLDATKAQAGDQPNGWPFSNLTAVKTAERR